MASKLLTLWILVFACSLAHGQTSVLLGGLSLHLNGTDYNKFHRMVIVEHDGWFGGYYYNSYYEDTFTAGYKFEITTLQAEGHDPVDFNVYAAMTYGYRGFAGQQRDRELWDDRSFYPAVAFQFEWSQYEWNPSINILGPAIAGAVRYEF